MKKKLLSLLLCTALLTGCQMTDSTEGANQSSAGEAAPEVSQAEETDSPETEEKEKEGMPADVVTLDLYVDFPWYPVDTWEGIIPEELTKNGGVYFDVTRSADDSQLGLMIASGDLPDVIFTSNEIDRLCDGNLCYGYDELIEQYGIDWQPTSDRIGIARSHNAQEGDEHYYTIIGNYSTEQEWKEAEGVVPNISCLYYRKDIWEELGEPSMGSLEEIADVCRMVKEKYPDMIPVSAGNPSWRLAPFRDWFGASNDFYYTEDNSVVYRDLLPGYYDYLKYVNNLYRDGLIVEENLAITNESDALQQVYSGKCFIYEWNARPNQLDQINTETKKIIPDAEWASVPIPDDACDIIRTGTGWAGVFISRNCKNPEAAIKMIAYMSTEEGRRLAKWGREGIDYVLDEKGVPQFSEEWLAASADGDALHKIYNNDYILCTTELDEAYSFYSGADPEVVANFAKNTDKIINQPELSLAAPVSTSEMGIILSKIREARDAENIKMYTAESDEAFEAAYQNYMDMLEQIGVQKLNDYMTQKVVEVKEDFGF